MSEQTDNVPITMTLTITASPWAPDGDDRIRRWSGPPPEDPADDIAARVERGGGCWPFKRWKWSVWSPFDGDAAEEGTAGSVEAAMADADAALRNMIAGVEREMVGA